MRRSWSLIGCCLVLLASSGCTGLPTPDDTTREELIERTRILLGAVLFEDAAASEAERFVDLCDDDPGEMFYMDHEFAWNPDGPELFGSLEEAKSSDSSSSIGIPLAASACTADGYVAVHNAGEI